MWNPLIFLSSRKVLFQLDISCFSCYQLRFHKVPSFHVNDTKKQNEIFPIKLPYHLRPFESSTTSLTFQYLSTFNLLTNETVIDKIVKLMLLSVDRNINMKEVSAKLSDCK